MKFLEKLAARFLKSRMTGFVVNLSVEHPHEDPKGWIYGNGWFINFGK